MKKRYIFFSIILFLILIPCVKAAYGDLNYQIENTVVTDDYIKFNGYAFIHRTNNFVTIYERDSKGGVNKNNVVHTNGGQKVKITITNKDGTKSLSQEHICKDDDYNFYYQMYDQGGIAFSVNNYNNHEQNKCNESGAKCYYEDLGFEIKFTVKDILENFSPDEEISFSISATNNHYQSIEGTGKWTNPVKLKISNIVNNSENIEIVKGQPSGKAKFIASDAVFQKFNEVSSYFTKDNKKVYAFDKNKNKSKYYYYNILDYDQDGYNDGLKTINNGIFKIDTSSFEFLKNTKGPSKFVVCMQPSKYSELMDIGSNSCDEINNYDYCTKCSGTIAAVYGSWITFDSTNQLIIKVTGGGCPVVTPSSGDLKCNNTKEFNSNCDELTISTSKGSAKVKIEQKGTISSILTPDSIFAGGGFHFGVIYNNSIKWSYVGTAVTGDLDSEVKTIMGNKIYEYDEYVGRINITQLNIGNKPRGDSFLEKKCTTSSDSRDYYDNELTVSCVFSFPEAILHHDGNVEYKTSTGNFNINNKYYTSIDYSGDYRLSAEIVGMSRIIDATKDSEGQTTPWTGYWEDTFKDCKINLYSLLLKNNGKYNFIYRPIDINNPFPNRNAGINWYDWILVPTNQDRIKNTYKKSDEYSASFDNKTISEIKEYNKSNNYLNWDNIDINGNSSFITDNSYINNGGGNQ